MINETTPVQELLPATRNNLIQTYDDIDEKFNLLSSSLYFPAAAPDKDDVWVTPVTKITNVLQKSGISDDHMRIALLNLLIMNSAHLGYPCALEIIDDLYAGADKIFHICSELTPKNFMINFSRKMTLDALYEAREDIKGKVIVAIDSIEFEKIKEKLNSFLKNQYFVDELHIDGFSVKKELKGPTGCLVITKNQKNVILADPSFFKFYLQSSSKPAQYVSELPEQERAMLRLNSKLLTKSFERLQYHQVKIPYNDQIINYLQQDRITQSKIETLLRILRIITIINNSPPMDKIEILTTFSKSDAAEISLALGQPDILPKELVATKTDYYIFHKLMSGLLQKEDVYISDLRKRIFNVVKKINLDKLNVTTFNGPDISKYEKLNVIKADNSPCWATMEQILNTLCNDGGPEVSESTLWKNIHEVIKFNFIGEGKISGTSRKGYFIKFMDIDDTIELPHPSNIYDGMNNKKIKIINPFSGEVDEI